MNKEDKALYGYMIYLLTKQFSKKELVKLVDKFYKVGDKE